MATFVTTIKFTPQGMASIQDSTKRAVAFRDAANKMGAKVRDIFWTPGPFDGLLLLDAPDEETATALMLHLGSLGNVQTQTARAFTASEMDKILKKKGR